MPTSTLPKTIAADGFRAKTRASICIPNPQASHSITQLKQHHQVTWGGAPGESGAPHIRVFRVTAPQMGCGGWGSSGPPPFAWGPLPAATGGDWHPPPLELLHEQPACVCVHVHVCMCVCGPSEMALCFVTQGGKTPQLEDPRRKLL